MNDLAAPGSAKMNYANIKEDILSQNSKMSNFKSPKTYTNDLGPSKPKLSNAPIKLIDFSKGFQINQEALEFLRSIKEEIIIVSVIGKARTGKSYLMNLLLNNNSSLSILLFVVIAFDKCAAKDNSFIPCSSIFE